jgi:hypothetical protein
MNASDLAFLLYQETLKGYNYEVITPSGCPVEDLITHLDKKCIELLTYDLKIHKKAESG